MSKEEKYAMKLAAIQSDMLKITAKVGGKYTNASNRRRRPRITSTPQYELMGRVQGMTAVYV